MLGLTDALSSIGGSAVDTSKDGWGLCPGSGYWTPGFAPAASKRNARLEGEDYGQLGQVGSEWG